jgi:hypothetical protein
MPTRMLTDGRRCPRCGSILVTDGLRVWCSSVGSQGRGPAARRPCAFGIDPAELLAALPIGEPAPADIQGPPPPTLRT